MNCNYCELSPSLETQLSLWLQLPCTNAAAEQQRPGCQKILWEMPKERPAEEEVAGRASGRVCPWGTAEEICANGACLVLGVLPVCRGSWLEWSCYLEVLCCRMLNRSSAP